MIQFDPFKWSVVGCILPLSQAGAKIVHIYLVKLNPSEKKFIILLKVNFKDFYYFLEACQFHA